MNLERIWGWLKHSLFSVVFMVAVVGYSVTFLAWQTATRNIELSQRSQSKQLGDSLEGALGRRLVSYQEILRGAAGLFAANGDYVDRNQWKTFVDTYDITSHYQGLQGISYLQIVPSDQLTEHEAEQQVSGVPNYTVNPKNGQNVYTPAVYIEPSDQTSRFGFDLSSEPERRQAIESARDGGQASITHVVELRKDNKPGFIMLYPLYKGKPTTVEDRRANILGYVAATVRVEELFQGIFSTDVPLDTSFGVVEGSALNQNFIFKTVGFSLNKDPLYWQTISVFGKQWTVEISVPRDKLPSQERNQPSIVLSSGILATTLVAVFVLFVTQSRAREINYRKQLELQDAKDELLSLASHQLRTPATGVKQYVGMVLEGYAGPVPKKQKDILRRAYESNDRQLEIVDQILHIARIESGRLLLDSQEYNVVKLVREIVNDQKPTFRARKQKLKTSLPKKQILANIDPHYMRMVIENLVTNASKYTHDGGQIAVTVVETKNGIKIEVSDTGVGIAPEDTSRLFQKFSRIHNELSISSGGTGIGLYLARLIAEIHGGSIEVVSRPGIGSTFRLTLPKPDNNV